MRLETFSFYQRCINQKVVQDILARESKLKNYKI